MWVLSTELMFSVRATVLCIAEQSVQPHITLYNRTVFVIFQGSDDNRSAMVPSHTLIGL